MNAVGRFVDRGAHCVDIGAHLGIYTNLFLRLVGREGRVTAFEPQPELVHYLERALAPEISQGRVEMHRTALSDAPGEAILSLPRDGRSINRGLASLARRDAGSLQMTVPVRRLDDFGLDDVNFVKCDVEGFELPVLRGAAAILDNSSPVLLVEIEERHSGQVVPQTFRHLEGLGYRAAIYRATDGAMAAVSLGVGDVPQVAAEWAGRYINNYFFVPEHRSDMLSEFPCIG